MVFRVSPVRRALSRSTGPEVRWRRLQKGAIPGEHRPGVREAGRGASSGTWNGRPRERTLGGSKASKRAVRPYAGYARRFRLVVQGRRAGQLARWTGRSDMTAVGSSRFPTSVALVPARVRRRLGRGAPVKPVGDHRDFRAGSAVESELARKHGSPEGGAALREGKALKGKSQGRLRHGTRPRTFRA